MAYLNDFASRLRKGIASPFTHVGLTWCPRCRSDVATETHAAHRLTTFVFRCRCRRCGAVLERGVYANVATLAGQPLPPAAVAWTQDPGADRR